MRVALDKFGWKKTIINCSFFLHKNHWEMMLRTQSGAYLVLGAFCELNNAAQTQKMDKNELHY